jgi:hypothetical protein
VEDPSGNPIAHQQVLQTCPNTEYINDTAVKKLYPRQLAERSEKTGVWGRIPQEIR